MLAEVLIFEPVSPHACPLSPPKLQHPLSWSSATSLAVTSCSLGKKLGGLHVYLDCSRRTAEMNLLVWVLRLKKAKSWNSPGPHYKSWYNHSVYKCSINHSPTMVYSPPWVLSTVQGPQPSTVAAFAPLFQSLEMSDSDQTHAFRSWICEKSATNKYLGVNNSAQKGKTWLVLKNTWPFLVKKTWREHLKKMAQGRSMSGHSAWNLLAQKLWQLPSAA